MFPHYSQNLKTEIKENWTNLKTFPVSRRHRGRAPVSFVHSVHCRVFTGDFRSDWFLAVSVCFPFTVPFSADRQRLYIQDTSISSPAPAPIWKTVKGWMPSNFWGQHASRADKLILLRERESAPKPTHYLALHFLNRAHSHAHDIWP